MVRTMMRRLAFVAAALGLCAMAQPASVAWAQQVEVQPETGAPGTRFVFITDGFKPNERISVWLNTPGGAVLPFSGDLPDRARSDGRASWNWAAPADAQLGFWQMVAQGRQSGTQRVFSFEIVLAAPSASQAGIQPTIGRQGSIFQFFVEGLKTDEPVDARLYQPDGRELEAALTVVARAGNDGRVDGNWTAPIDAPIGTWRIVVRGVESGIERTITFQLQPREAQISAAVVVSPQVGTPGMRFVFTATAFQSGEKLSIWFNAPDGTVVAFSDRPQVQPDKRASWDWVSPTDAARGMWQAVVHGSSSQIEQVITFQIQ